MGNTSNKVDRIKATKIMEFFSKMNANKTKKDVDISDKAKRQKLSKSLSNIAEINDTDQYDDIYSNKRTERTNDINLKKNEPRIGYRDGPFLDNQEIYSEVTDNKATNRGNQNTVGVEHENNNIKVDRINTTKIRKNNEHCTNETRKSQEYLPKSDRKKLFLINLDKIRTFFSKIILNKTKTDVDESDVGKTQIEAKSKKQKFKKIFLQRELSKSLPAIAEINDTDQYDEIYSNKMKEKANVLIVKMNETRNFYRDRPFLGNHEIYAEVTDYKATNSGNESTIRVGYNNSNNNEEKYAIRTCWKCQYCNKVNVKSSFWCIVCRREDLIEEAIVIKIICEVDSFEQNKPKFINTKFLETIHVLQMLKLDAMFWYYLQRNFYENVIEPYDVIQALNDLTKINDIKYILQRKCPLCLDCFPLSKMHNMLYCACQFCKTCYKDWVREVIMNSSCDKLLCPSCPEMNFAKKNTSLYFLSFQEIVNSDETLRNVYYEKRMSEFIDRDANTMWCTNDRCSYGFDISNHVNDKIKCPKCNELSCKKCKNKWHENEFCDFTKQNGNQNIFQDFSHKLIDCPKCKAKFYLDKGGCLHLNCKKCKHEFCECCKKQFVREGCKEQNCPMPNIFHAHHPKYCAYFLRDLDVNELESQIQDFEKPKNSTLTLCDIEIYNKSSKASKCSKPCYKDTGLCTDHFKEYIAALIFKKNRENFKKSNCEQLNISKNCKNRIINNNLINQNANNRNKQNYPSTVDRKNRVATNIQQKKDYKENTKLRKNENIVIPNSYIKRIKDAHIKIYSNKVQLGTRRIDRNQIVQSAVRVENTVNEVNRWNRKYPNHSAIEHKIIDKIPRNLNQSLSNSSKAAQTDAQRRDTHPTVQSINQKKDRINVNVAYRRNSKQPLIKHGNTDKPLQNIHKSVSVTSLIHKPLTDRKRNIEMRKFSHLSKETCIDSSSTDRNSQSDNETSCFIDNSKLKMFNADSKPVRKNSEYFYHSMFDISNKEIIEFPVNRNSHTNHVDDDCTIDTEMDVCINETVNDGDQDSHESFISEEHSIPIINKEIYYPEFEYSGNNENQIFLQEENELKRLSVASAISSNFSFGSAKGLNNPKGYCFLNSVIQVLRGCHKFHSGICKYHEESGIKDTKEQDDVKIIFVINFCSLFYKLKIKRPIDDHLNEIQQYFISSSSGDDVNKCFMNLLSTINDVIKNPKSGTNDKSDAEKTYQTYKNMNYGFLFDCFYGLLSFALTCEKCKFIVSNRFQLLKSLCLPVPKTSDIIKLENCLELLFEKSKVEIEDAMKCNCVGGTKEVSLINEIAVGPKYLFVYLDRGSLMIDGEKKTTFVTCSDVIEIQTTSKILQYKLISVIDHIGTSVNGHYFCKCNYETENWYILNDTDCRFLGPCSTDKIVTKNAIVFMLKKLK